MATDAQVTISFVLRAARILLSAAATALALIPFEVTAPAAAADGQALSAADRVQQREQPEAAPAESQRWIERAPGVGPTTAPLEFGFAVVDWLLGG